MVGPVFVSCAFHRSSSRLEHCDRRRGGNSHRSQRRGRIGSHGHVDQRRYWSDSVRDDWVEWLLSLSAVEARRANRPGLSFETPDTGTVRGDIILILRRISEMVDELRPEVIFGLIAELLHESDSSLFAEVHERNAKIMVEILNRGVGRGEIAAEKLTLRLAALPFDLVRHQLVLLQQPLSPQDIEEIIDRIFLPLVRAD
jgi:hypothetical protein